MNQTRLLNVEMLYLLWAIPVAAGLLFYAAHKRRQALARFAEPRLLKQMGAAADAGRRAWKTILLLTAFALAVIALARPAWNMVQEETERRGRDVVFLLDVSRSMLAEDLAPNRLERAKLAILDSVERLRGDRVALVAFAGTAAVKCPLTHDYGFFRQALEESSPASVSRGGTLIGDAIRTTIEQVFDNQARSFRDVILITDGEDHESYPEEAARKLGELGARLIAVGLGDEHEGRRIPVTGADGQRTFLTYNGQEVWSRLDTETLRKMVSATPGGRYLNVATGSVDFGDVYVKLVSGAGQADLGPAKFVRYEEKYQIFLAIAFVLLCVELCIGERKARSV
ncbi:MAG: VWA domain-containing protein [Bryobacteraceae bacterium]|nr:VWA domain-containing protein [Bryobacteraceae bacterium]